MKDDKYGFERELAEHMCSTAREVDGAIEFDSVSSRIAHRRRRARRRAMSGAVLGVVLLGIGVAALPGRERATSVRTGADPSAPASSAASTTVLCVPPPLDSEVVGWVQLSEVQHSVLNPLEVTVEGTTGGAMLTEEQVDAIVRYARALGHPPEVDDWWPLTYGELRKLEAAGAGLDGEQVFDLGSPGSPADDPRPTFDRSVPCDGIDGSETTAVDHLTTTVPR